MRFVYLVGFLVLINLVTIFLYWWDKRQAVHGGERVPETLLLLAGFLGGSPGAFYAQRTFRHKTKKQPFQLVFWLLVGVQLYLVCFVLPEKIIAVY